MQQDTTNNTIKVNIGTGDGLVPSGNKPSPESMLTKFYDAIRHLKGPLS